MTPNIDRLPDGRTEFRGLRREVRGIRLELDCLQIPGQPIYVQRATIEVSDRVATVLTPANLRELAAGLQQLAEQLVAAELSSTYETGPATVTLLDDDGQIVSLDVDDARLPKVDRVAAVALEEQMAATRRARWIDDEQLAKVAEAYRQAKAERRSTQKAVAQDRGISVGRAAQLIAQARKAGHLPPAPPRRRKGGSDAEDQ